MTKEWKRALRGLSSFRSLSRFSEVEEMGSIHVRDKQSWILLLQTTKYDVICSKNEVFIILSVCPIAQQRAPLLISSLVSLRRVLVRFKHAKEELRWLWISLI